MAIFFEVLKWIFFFMTILVWLFFLRWDVVIWENYYYIVKQIMMPWYLLFCWLMLWYIIAHIRNGSDIDNPDKKSIYIKSFLIGIIVGLILSVLYIIV